uniref:UPF0547 protein C16orf87 homolog isoform X2 n=1 Tax=Saccoglossus kowalevskii TaxID=10224 RepID=A0ABM0MPT8_SACKO|nr:PREDICTED: UPF0547 protein C16orf87 homolog isoform X2 [Saccoglossus kowalevskii]
MPELWHTEQTDVKRRRTERVKRERPDYYSASEIENHIKRINKYEASVAAAASASTSSSSSKDKESSADGGPPVKRRKPGRPKGSVNKPKDGSEREDDAFANISTEKELVYSVVLAEINRKIQSQWRGPLTS